VLSTEKVQQLGQSDANLYYAGTYVRMKSKTDSAWKWWYAECFHGRGSKMTVCLNDGATTKLEKYYLKDSDFDFAVPEARTYNYRGHSVRLARSAVRQNRKGLSPETYKIVDFLKPFYGYIPNKVLNQNIFVWHPKCLDVLFEKMTEIPLDKAILSVTKQQAISRALGDNFILSQGILSKSPTLWYMERPIGEFNVKSEKVSLKNPHFEEEATRLFDLVNIPVSH
jgi:hypothetical protein